MKNMKKMKFVIAALCATFIVGCGSVDDSKVDVDFANTTECPVCPVCPENTPNSELLRNLFTQNIALKIDPSNIKMNHYINESMVSENYNEIIDTYLGDRTSDLQSIIMSDDNLPAKHIIIIEFTQVN